MWIREGENICPPFPFSVVVMLRRNRMRARGRAPAIETAADPRCQSPASAVLFDAKGNLYGTTTYGGAWGARMSLQDQSRWETNDSCMPSARVVTEPNPS